MNWFLIYDRTVRHERVNNRICWYVCLSSMLNGVRFNWNSFAHFLKWISVKKVKNVSKLVLKVHFSNMIYISSWSVSRLSGISLSKPKVKIIWSLLFHTAFYQKLLNSRNCFNTLQKLGDFLANPEFGRLHGFFYKKSFYKKMSLKNTKTLRKC